MDLKWLIHDKLNITLLFKFKTYCYIIETCMNSCGNDISLILKTLWLYPSIPELWYGRTFVVHCLKKKYVDVGIQIVVITTTIHTSLNNVTICFEFKQQSMNVIKFSPNASETVTKKKLKNRLYTVIDIFFIKTFEK
jgi:hypothetical protein